MILAHQWIFLVRWNFKQFLGQIGLYLCTSTQGKKFIIRLNKFSKTGWFFQNTFPLVLPRIRLKRVLKNIYYNIAIEKTTFRIREDFSFFSFLSSDCSHFSFIRISLSCFPVPFPLYPLSSSYSSSILICIIIFVFIVLFTVIIWWFANP